MKVLRLEELQPGSYDVVSNLDMVVVRRKQTLPAAPGAGSEVDVVWMSPRGIPLHFEVKEPAKENQVVPV